MPGMNGFEFLRRLQEDASRADLPVIVRGSAILEPDARASLRRASPLLSKSGLASPAPIDAIASVAHVHETAGAA